MLARIVGRDTAALDKAEVLRATIETLAENLSDAVIAPLLYLGLGGPAAMAAYKAINTLDSMVGYRNERYREFGWASARLDDLANFIPARLTAVAGVDVRRPAALRRAALGRRDAARCAARSRAPTRGIPRPPSRAHSVFALAA